MYMSKEEFEREALKRAIPASKSNPEVWTALGELFDKKSYIYWSRKTSKKYKYPTIKIKSTDDVAMKVVKKILGGSVRTEQELSGNPIAVYEVTGKKAYTAAKQLLPYTSFKSDYLLEIINYYEQEKNYGNI